MADAVPEPLEATLRRLQRERDEADQRYNEALTGVDLSLRPPADLPQPALAVDDHQITALNESWNILPSEPRMDGIKGRLAGFVWRLIGPYLQRQLAFNSRLVDHINRTAATARESHRVAEATNASLREQFESLMHFQGRLMVYLQQVTAYVDTKDRHMASGALVVNASISGMAESVARRWESLAARVEARHVWYEERSAALGAVQEDLRAMIGVSQHALASLKREVERLLQMGSGVQGVQGVQEVQQAPRDAFAPALDSYKYVGFEDQFRGSRDVIRERLESYLPMFDGRGDVLDVGCGRGEFLDLLAARGIAARGIDRNHEMAEICRARGLDVTEADAVAYLSSLPDASLGGIFAAQVVEHLQPGYLLQFLELAFHKLRPGGRLVIETLNPACWVAFFESYIRDITHVWPLHPETLKYLVVASGFTRAHIEFRSPVPEQDRLQPMALAADASPELADLAVTINGNVAKLNQRMFTHMDYAIVGEK